MAQTIVVVLAGGEGRRMGGPKGDLRVDGMTLAERAAKILRPLCGTVVISLPRGARNPAPAFAVVEDEPPSGRGPLAGIAAAFASSGRADLFVSNSEPVACAGNTVPKAADHWYAHRCRGFDLYRLDGPLSLCAAGLSRCQAFREVIVSEGVFQQAIWAGEIRPGNRAH